MNLCGSLSLFLSAMRHQPLSPQLIMVADSKNAAEPAHASFDGLLELEQTFYQAGFDGGFPHGELHGLFEGRELGREKSWELWEEIGYYEGTATLWQAILQKATPGNVR